VIAVDGTWWRLMKKGASKWWCVWPVAREDAVSYRLLSSRSTDAARTVLGDSEAGEMIDRIAQLYAIEAEAKRASPGPIYARPLCEPPLISGGHVRARPQVTEILRRIGAGPPACERAIVAEDLPPTRRDPGSNRRLTVPGRDTRERSSA